MFHQMKHAAIYAAGVGATVCLTLALAASPALAQAPVKAAAGLLTDAAGMTLYVFDKDTAGSGMSVGRSRGARWSRSAASGPHRMCNRFRVSPGQYQKLVEAGILPPFPPDEDWRAPSGW